MKPEPFTPATLRRDNEVPIPEGAFLLAKTIAYRVDRVQGRTLHVTRWPRDEVPKDALVYCWTWTPRAPRQVPERHMVYSA